MKDRVFLLHFEEEGQMPNPDPGKGGTGGD